MRGKPNKWLKQHSRFRNIPAYAGKTNLVIFQGIIDEEHPRVCGENGDYTAGVASVGGTSPRMRGKPSGEGKENRDAGNIPAYAGKTD